MSFLVVNCGTSSIKMTLFNKEKKRLIEGGIKNLFTTKSILNVNDKKVEVSPQSYSIALEILLDHFKQEGFVPSSLLGVGHRVVHGGEKYIKSVVITGEVESDLKALSDLAPLHNPPAIRGIEYTQHIFPHIPQIAVFDTAFHANIPQKAAFYPIPWALSQKYSIKKYGFHGIAHSYSLQRYVQTYEKNIEKKRIITAHLGSGCSLAAILSSKSVDTTMGFTPLDGLMMATRCGELDPSIIAFLCDKEKKSPNDILSILNNKSGLLGVSGTTADMQEILLKAPTNPQANLALDMFTYRVQQKIGAFIATLEGVDAIIFSGGIGENSWEIREKIIKTFSWYSILIDKKKNRLCTNLNPGDIHNINLPGSKVSLYVVGCDENLFIVDQMIEVLSAHHY